MNLGGVNSRQLGLVYQHSLRHSLRSGAGLVFLLLALFAGLTVAYAIIGPYEGLVATTAGSGLTPAQVENQLVQMSRMIINWAIAPEDTGDAAADAAAQARQAEWVGYLLDEQPALLSAIFLILLIVLPLLVPFGAFNQTAGDIGNRGLRYLLLRTERGNIFYGRLFATMTLTAVVICIVFAIVAAYVAVKVRAYTVGEVVGWSSLGLLALLAACLPYVALCAWLSARQDSPTMALVVCFLVIIGVWVGALMGSWAYEPARYLEFLLPWGVQPYLLAPDRATVLLSVLACIAYTVLFAWLGGRTFAKRDL